LRLPLGLFCLLAFAGTVAGWSAPLDVLPREVRWPDLLTAVRLCLTLLFILSLVLVAVDRRATLRVTLHCLVGGVLAWYLALFLLFVPAFDKVWNGPVRAVAGHIKDYPDALVITYFAHELGLNFHTGRPYVAHWREGTWPDLADILLNEQPVFVLVEQPHRDEMEGLNFYAWGESPRFLYGANFPPPED
jgi:hypothetical protein